MALESGIQGRNGGVADDKAIGGTITCYDQPPHNDRSGGRGGTRFERGNKVGGDGGGYGGNETRLTFNLYDYC